MSMALTLYLVELERVHAAIGSRDDKLRRQISGRFKDDFARADEYFDHEISGGAPTRRDALRAVIEGGPFDRAHGFQYAYAYQAICRHFGAYLDNNWFSPFRGSWVEDVDRGLERLGMTPRVMTFMYGGLPEPLPRPDDFPSYGEWSPELCRRGLAEWQAATAEQRAAVDREALSAIESCVGWMRAAVGKPGAGVAGFGA
jgi:hypothetical protein